MGTRRNQAIAYCIEIEIMNNLHGTRWIGVTAPSTQFYFIITDCQTEFAHCLYLLKRSEPVIESSLSRSTSTLVVMLDTECILCQFRANYHSSRISIYAPRILLNWLPTIQWSIDSIAFHDGEHQLLKATGPAESDPGHSAQRLVPSGSRSYPSSPCRLSHYPYSRYGVYLYSAC